jgi:hypothetical protein
MAIVFGVIFIAIAVLLFVLIAWANMMSDAPTTQMSYWATLVPVGIAILLFIAHYKLGW